MIEVLIGAASWETTAWFEEFYPEDLPSDWQLSYYANEFSTVLIDCCAYRRVAEWEKLACRLAECHSGFRPVLGIALDQLTVEQAAHFFQRLERIDEESVGQRVAGVMLSSPMTDLKNADLRAWRDCIPSEIAVAIDLPDKANKVAIEQFALMNISIVWRAGQEIMGGQSCWLSMISLDVDARQLAQQVAAFLDTATTAAPVCMIASDGFQKIGNLRELASIVRLING